MVGLSPAGLSMLPLSSVIPDPLPDRLGSDPDATASIFVVVDIMVDGEDVVCASLALKRDLDVEIGEGADWRVLEGAVYE